MGILLSRFRKKKTRVETLEDLENKIKEIEENRSYAQRRYNRITKLLFLYSIGLYVLCGIFFYFHFTSTLKGKLLYLVPLALSPLVLYIINRIISWYYVRMISKNQSRLNEMKKEKKRLLDEVMDKETYKVAKEILEKFSEKPPQNMKLLPRPQLEEGLRKRVVNVPNMPNPQSQIMARNLAQNQVIRQANPITQTKPGLQVPAPRGVSLPAPIFPLERSYVDRVFEYLIGDGPNNRYALICSRCHSHNGMALKEEFEYMGFKCCYCFNYNPARKLRPEAPKLENLSKEFRDSDSDSDSKNSGENSEIQNKSDLNHKEDQEEKLVNNEETLQDQETDENKEITGPESMTAKLNDESKDNENDDTDITREFEKSSREPETSEDPVPVSGSDLSENNCNEFSLKS